MMDFQHWPEATGFLDYLKKTQTSMADIASTPFEVLEQAGSMQLRKYKAQDSKAHPILILPSVINRSFVLDLLPEKSLIRNFLAHGHDVYLIDWGVPQSHEQDLTFESLLTLYIDFFLKRIEFDSQGRKTHVLGHCLGGTIGLILANLQPDRFLSLSLITAPVSFLGNDKLSAWARHADFDLSAFTEAYGNVPWFMLQSAFIALKPTQVFSKCRQFLQKSNEARYLRNFWALEAWSNDNVNLRGGCFNVLIRDLYCKNALQEGTLTFNGKKVSLHQYSLPTFVLLAPQDHIVPLSSHLTGEMVPQVRNLEVVRAEGGHVGALLSGQSQKVVWPKLTEWIKNCES